MGEGWSAVVGQCGEVRIGGADDRAAEAGRRADQVAHAAGRAGAAVDRVADEVAGRSRGPAEDRIVEHRRGRGPVAEVVETGSAIRGRVAGERTVEHRDAAVATEHGTAEGLAAVSVCPPDSPRDRVARERAVGDGDRTTLIEHRPSQAGTTAADTAGDAACDAGTAAEAGTAAAAFESAAVATATATAAEAAIATAAAFVIAAVGTATAAAAEAAAATVAAVGVETAVAVAAPAAAANAAANAVVVSSKAAADASIWAAAGCAVTIGGIGCRAVQTAAATAAVGTGNVRIARIAEFTTSCRVARQRAVLNGQRPLIEDGPPQPRRAAATAAAGTRTAAVAADVRAAAQRQVLQRQVARTADHKQTQVGHAAIPRDRQPMAAGRTTDRDRRRDRQGTRPKFVVPRDRELERLIPPAEQPGRERDRVRPAPRRGTIHRRVGVGRLNGLPQRHLTIARRVVGQAGDHDRRQQRAIFQPLDPPAAREPAPTRTSIGLVGPTKRLFQ